MNESLSQMLSWRAITFLSVPSSSRALYPGSYFRIKVGDISLTEWHPFSLAGSVSSHHLTFFVASFGDWTTELYNIVSDPIRRASTRIQVQLFVMFIVKIVLHE